MTITYRLHRAAFWQDGAPLTSADVAFTYHALTQSGINSPYTGFYRSYVPASRPRIHTRLWCGSSTVCAGSWAIVRCDDRRPHRACPSPRALGEHQSGSVQHASGGERTVRSRAGTTGRTSCSSHSQVTSAARRICTRSISTQCSIRTVMSMLESHELDVAGVVPTESRRFASSMDTSAARFPPALRVLSFNLRRAPFDDVVVQRALTLALDRSRISKSTSNGIAYPARTLIRRTIGPTKTIRRAWLDPQRARAMLTADGWIAKPDGIR